MDDMLKTQREMDSLLLKMKTFEKDQNDKENKLRSEIVDLKCRSMRDNLLFFQIPEEKDENCETKLLNFIENELGIVNASTQIQLHRAHRVGPFKRGKTRPIVAKFAYYPDRERVLIALKTQRRELRNSGEIPEGSNGYPPETHADHAKGKGGWKRSITQS